MMDDEHEDIADAGGNDCDEEMPSSDDGTSSDDDDDARETKIVELHKMVESDPYNYYQHVQLITLLRKDGDLDRLRKACENMNRIFPLSTELWLDWLKDEISVTTSPDGRQSVKELFERAVKDYTSVNVWLDYCQFLLGEMGQDNDLKNIREVFEKAVTAVGLHVTSGHLIWEMYREFESAVLSTMQPKPGLVSDAKSQASIEEQLSRISAIYRRQLSIPHQDMEETYEEYENWEQTVISENLKLSYQNALKKMKKLSTFEKNLIASNPPHLQEYLSYIEFEESEDDPVRVQSIYERSLCDNCLVPNLWINYCNYVNKRLKVGNIVMPLYERAVRNCPWSPVLWIGYLRAAERAGNTYDAVKTIFDRAIAVGFSQGDDYRQIWLTYLECLARRVKWSEIQDNAELLELRSAFQNAVDQIKMCFPSDGDPSCIIQQYWARLEARHLRNMEKVRQIWTEIMACGNGKYAHMWLEYANIERSFGDVEHERKVLQRGVQSASDWPETIIDMLMNLERDVGTLEQWDHAVVRCEAQIKRVEGRRLKAAEKEALIQKSESDKKKRNRFEKKSTKFQQDTRDTASKHHNKFEEKSSPKKGDNEYSKAKKRPPPPGYKREQPDEKKIKKSDTEDKTEEQTFHDNDKTVFLSNLAYMLDEETIKDFFRSVGTVADLRLVKDFHGRSRGYAYLEFQTTTEAEMALKMDRQLINGRPVFVSRCQSEKLKSDRRKFKYNTDIEKNKLFIKGLSFATTQKDLEETFEKYGKLKEVRLVTYRSGKSKGLAYVDYEDEADAAKALVTTDGMTIHDKVISVDISNPPQRKNQQEDDEQTSALMTIRNSLGRGTTDLGSRGKGRTNVSLLPRALQNKLQSSSVTSDSTNGSASSEPTKKLSNADFRSMLLSKK